MMKNGIMKLLAFVLSLFIIFNSFTVAFCIENSQNSPKIAKIQTQGVAPKAENILKRYAFVRQGSAFIPKYDVRIELYVSNKEGHPQTKPITPRTFSITSPLLNNLKTTANTQTSAGSPGTVLRKSNINALPSVKQIPKTAYYTSGSQAAFININSDKKRWFAYKLKNAQGAKKVLWQVSNNPFDGSNATDRSNKTDGSNETDVSYKNWRTPVGLVSSGEVPVSAGEFLIDFNNIEKRALSNLKNLNTNYKSIPQAQKNYYVRAVPVDATGKPIGDPGQGISVVFGKQQQNTLSKTKYSSSELWTTFRTSVGEYNGEFQDRPAKNSVISVSPKILPNSRVFHFNNLSSEAQQVAIQVSKYPFTGKETWPSAVKFLYEKVYNTPVSESTLPSYFPKSQYPSTVMVPFSQFGMKAEKLKEEEYIKYYVRGVILKPSVTPGMMDIEYTNTITVNYGYGKQVKIYQPPQPKYEYINKALPSIKIVKYEPVQWASSDYLQHYYVYRTPTADEIKCSWVNSITKEVLYPYDVLFGQTYYKAQGINSKQQYEQIVIPRVLKTGTKVYFAPPKKEDKDWYEELYDGIVEFFEDLASAATTIVNQVSSAYNGLKSGLVNFVAELCPIPSLKGAFKMALEGLVNYGLVAVGLPPTLPNFDQLSSMSLDYLADVALTEAGIPENQLTDELTKKISDSIKDEIKKATNHADANPINSTFLKLDPDYTYRPAFVDVEISNKSPYTTVPGSFNLDVTFEFDYYNMFYNSYDPYDGINFTSANPYIPGSSAALSTSSQYMEHFLYGLNGNTVKFKNGEKAVYDVFMPVKGQKVPILMPYETRTVRIYLAPFSLFGGSVFSRYPTGDMVSADDFSNMYFGNGNKKFNNFYINGQFPSALEYMNSDGKYYLVTDPESTLDYKYRGNINDFIKEKPVLSGWNK